MKIRHLLCAAVAAATFAGPVRADNAQRFLTDAFRGDNSEVRLGGLAESRGASPDVRNYGTRLVQDHQMARQQMFRLRDRYRVRPDNDLTPDALREWNKLQGLRGPDFDREFIRYMVDDHREDIGRFQAEARAHDGPLSDLAGQQLPTLQRHLDMALSIQSRLGNRFAGPGYVGGLDHGGWNGRGDHR